MKTSGLFQKTSVVLQKTLHHSMVCSALLVVGTSTLKASESVQTTLYDLNKTVSVGGTEISDAVSLNGDSFFIAPYGEQQTALWHYASADQKEYVIELGLHNPVPRLAQLTVLNNQLYFTARDENQQTALWRYDADDACRCAQKVGRSFTAITDIVTQNGQLLLVAATESTGSELWHLDLESDSFNLIKDFNPGANGSNPGNLVFSEAQMYFLANDGNGYRELWSYNANSAELVEYGSINNILRREDAHYYAHIVAAKSNRVAIEIEKQRLGNFEQKRGSQLWLLNANNNVARQIDDINHFAKCDDGDGYYSYFIPTQAIFSDDSLYYVADPDTSYDRIWRYHLSSKEKTNIGEGQISEFDYNSRCGVQLVTDFHVKNNDFYFARTGSRFGFQEDGLWHFDVDQQSLSRAAQVSNIESVADSGDTLFVKGRNRDNAHRIYTLDFASNQVSTVTNDRGFSFTPKDFTLFDSSETPLFAARTTKWGRQLWQLDSALNAARLTSVASENTASNPGEKFVLNDRLYFLADSEVAERKLWYVEANDGAVPKLHPFVIPEEFGQDPDIQLEVVAGDNLYFSIRGNNRGSRTVFWRLSAADATVSRLTSLEDVTSLNLSLFTVNDGQLYFSSVRTANQDYASSRLIEYQPASDTASIIYRGDGKILHLDEDKMFLLRILYNEDGTRRFNELWRLDRQDNSLQQLETASETGTCLSYTFGPQYIKEAAGYYYLFRDFEFLRLDPSDDSLVSLGCVEEMFTLADDIYYVERGANPVLMRLPAGSVVGEQVSDLHVRDHQIENDVLYFSTSNSQSLKTVWQYDPTIGSVQQAIELNEERVNLERVMTVGDRVYAVIFGYQWNRWISYLWEIGTEQPAFEFIANATTFRNNKVDEWAVFAGDIWLSGSQSQAGYSYQDELLRLHLNTAARGNHTLWDFDGDGKADPTFRDKFSQFWTVFNSDDQSVDEMRFGFQETDLPVSADFDGDGIFDLAFRRPGNAFWVVLNSSGSNYNSNEQDGIQRIRLGMNALDIPVPADYDGDGIADFAVRRPSFGGWIIRQSSDGKVAQIRFGNQESDIPVTGDFDGDGKADLAFRRTSNKTWYVQNSSNSNFNSARQDGIQRTVFGSADEDIPVPADYDGDGITDFAVWRPSNSRFVIRYSRTGEAYVKRFDNAQDAIPVPADYDGDGTSDAAVYHPATGVLEVNYFILDRKRQSQFNFTPDVFPVARPITETIKQLSSD